ncbi:MAG: ATP-binding cassette domain-containing protein [Anaeromyxobacter sp.]
MSAVVQLSGVTLLDRSGRPLVEGLDLEVAAGEAVVISAPPEIGTVVLRSLVGLEVPARGTVRLLGEDVLALAKRAGERLLAGVGYLPRHGALVSNLPIRENLVLPVLWHRHVPREEALEAATRSAARFGLDELPAVIPPLASMSVRRRAALARAAVLEPSVLLLDDPTEDLDPHDAGDVAGRLAATAKALGAAVLATSHEYDVPMALQARVLHLRHPPRQP